MTNIFQVKMVKTVKYQEQEARRKDNPVKGKRKQRKRESKDKEEPMPPIEGNHQKTRKHYNKKMHPKFM